MKRKLTGTTCVALLICVTMQAQADTDLEEVVVTAHAYKPVDPSPAAKIQADAHDLPVTVDQITASLMSDRAVTTIDEAIDSIAGVRLIPGFPGSSGYLVRGFFESYNVLVDGFRDQQGLYDPQGIDRIDVLKGPPSVLFGAQSPGGALNIVSKIPFAKPTYSVEAMGGSYSDRRFTADVNQPISPNLLFRINGSYEDSNSFRDFVSSETRLLAPTLTWRISDQDTLTVRTSYNEFNYTYYSDFPPDIRLLALPISRSFSEPGAPQSQSHEWRGSYEYVHDFSEEWRLRSALAYNDSEVDHGLSRVYYPTLEADGRTLDRTLEEGPQYTKSLTAQEELFGQFATGAAKHNVVVGVEYYDERYHYIDNFANIAPLDIFNPVYGSKPGPVTFGYAGANGDHDVGIYAQDLVSFAVNWKALVGARWDRNSSFYDSEDSTGAVSSRVDAVIDHFSPRVGLIYQPVPSTSIYGSWSRSFFPQIFYTAANGLPLPADYGRQFELGVKQDLLDKHLSLTAALFQINRENVATPDPTNPNFYVATGEQRSRGLELSAVGQITRSWNLIATYAYTDAAVVRDESIPVGDRLAGVPRNAFSLWTTYESIGGVLPGLGAGVGVTYASSRPATLPNSFTLDSYTRLDGMVSYRFAAHLRLAVNLKNITNARYYDTDGGYALRPGAPRTVLVSLRADY